MAYRTIQQIVTVAAAVLFVSRAAPADAQTAPPSRPNVLFLLSDDHSYPFLSCYDDPNVKTPALDRFASEGIKFHRFFTTAPQCVPSRASLAGPTFAGRGAHHAFLVAAGPR